MPVSSRMFAVLISALVGCTGVVAEPSGSSVTFDPTSVGGDGGDGGAAANGMADDGSSDSSGGAGTGGTPSDSTGTSGASGGSDGSTGGSGSSGGTTPGGTNGTVDGGSTGSSTGGDSGGGADGGESGGSASGGDSGPASGGDPAPSDPCGDGGEPLATGLRLRELALYQAVKIPLVSGGIWQSSRSAPVVAGKRALVRAFVDTLSGFTSRTLRGVLTLDNDGKLSTINAELRPTGASADATLSSTFNFDVEGSLIGPRTKLSVSLQETVCDRPVGNASDVRFPLTGTQELDAEAIGKLRVVLVPITIGGRTPDTSAQQVAKLRAAMLAHYPVPAVEITTRSPVSTGITVSSSGGGWSDILNLVIRTRQQDGPASDVYYYGVIAPSNSFQSFCGYGCVLGLAPQTTRVSPSQQAGLGVGFSHETTASTMVHEMAHAHGRGHAPCAQGGSIQGVDSRFPYAGGGTGVWGWDSRNGSLKNPAQMKDVMGYCDPSWVSDYTYDALATRSTQVNAAARLFQGPRTQLTTMLLYADGTARWAGMSTEERPGGDAESATVLDQDGEILGEVEVIRLKLSHVDDELLYLPDPASDWAALELSDRTIVLDSVAAPL